MPKSGSGSPGKRPDYHDHHHHHYQPHHYYKKSRNEYEQEEDESHRYNDLRDRLNELRKSKESKERTSSSDRSKQSLPTSHSSYQEDRSNYYRSKRPNQELESASSSYYKQSYSQYKSKTYNNLKTSPTRSSSKSDKYQNEAKKTEETSSSKQEKTKLNKMMTDAEVNEIVSEEELSNEELEPENDDSKDSKKEEGEIKRETDEENSQEDEAEKSDAETKDSDRSDISSKNSSEKSPKRIKSRTAERKANKSRSPTKSTDSSHSESSKNTPRDDKSRDHTPDKQTDTESIDTDTDDDEYNRRKKQRKRSDRTRSGSKESKASKISETDKNDDTTPKKIKEDSVQIVEKTEEKIEFEEKDEKVIECPPKTILYYCATQGCRSVEEFECLNKIEEGAYGVVYRAKDKKTNEQVALKRLKMEKEKDGFPITSLREVDTLLKCQHPNIVTVREIVVGSNMDKIYMVMDFVEHDLKSLMQYGMKKPFLMSEVKCLMLQLLSGIAHLHDNWIIHRDLKTSNLLLSHKGILKIADFGLAREYGSPLKEYTPVVVTLWYRSPELLLNTKKYSTSIDMWSVGCIFGELMLMKALFPGKNEKDQLDKIFKDLGTPTDKIWPEFRELPLTKKLNFPDFPYNTLRSRFGNYLSDKGFELINKLLTYDPEKRISAEDALEHEFFRETPMPIDPSLFPTWPAKSEGFNKKQIPKDSEPRAPSAGKMYEKLLEDEGFVLQAPSISTGFQLRI